jgi:myo-inositol-1-phosphate synthase
MKILLVASLILNVVLGVLYFQAKSQPPIERIIMEHKVERVHDERRPRAPAKKAPHPQGAMMVNTYDADTAKVAEEVSEQVQSDRLEFLTGKLNLSQQDLDQIEKIKEQYFRNLHKVSTANGEPSLEQRRQALDIEAKRNQEFIRVMGKKNWEKFKNFKNDYNQRKFEEHSGDYGVVVPLDI